MKAAMLLEDEEAVAPELTVNEAYARRFAYNKKREDLHRLQELEKKGLVHSDGSSSSSEEEDEDGLLPPQTDVAIFDTLTKIKKQDPCIYSSETQFYKDLEEENGAVAPVKKAKPLYLKDVNARQLLETRGNFLEQKVLKPREPLSYVKEQDELKRAFLQGVAEFDAEEDDYIGGILKVKIKTKEQVDKEKQEDEEAVAEADQRQKDAGISRKLEEYFGKDDDLDENEKFLKNYLLNKGWIDNEQRPYDSYANGIVGDVSEDEEEVEKQEKFEAEYNFRFQEGDNFQVLGHSRVISNSVRKKPETRKKTRQNKKQRLEEADLARREELKRLKNVRKKEILEKLSKIREVAGVGADSRVEVLGEEVLEEDFDPHEYDEKMKEVFGDAYYGAEDVDDDFGADDLEKPDFDAEDELLGIVKVSDEITGFKAVYEKQKQKQVAIGEASGKIPLRQKLMFEKQLEDYYKLDYEDMVGDLPTRFKYRLVKPNRYGLKSKQLLLSDDKELNQVVSLKKLATYNTEDWQPKRRFHVNKPPKKNRERRKHPHSTSARATQDI